MKVVILAGGFGTQLSEETNIKPKPMVEIGEKTDFMVYNQNFFYYGFNEFVICLDYTCCFIKEYFTNYFLHQPDIPIELEK